MSTTNRNSIQWNSLRNKVARTMAASVVVLGLAGGTLWAQRPAGAEGDQRAPRHPHGRQPERHGHFGNAIESQFRQVELRTPSVRTTGDITFHCQGAGYDDCYKDHWRITSLHGSMTFRFPGGRSFVFHGLGSTSEGQSYCFVNVYVNGQLERDRMFIEKEWRDYVVPVREFGSGENTVRIELVGQTHLWIDQATVR
jgi:hypothetical protein